MRKLPEIPTWENTTHNTQTFLGLNRGLSIADGEMADMLNMCSDQYPVLSTRGSRGTPVFPVDGGGKTYFDSDVSGMLGTDRVIVCSGGKVYMDGVEVPITLSDEEHMKPKHLVSMGAYVCIWPDKKYFNAANASDYGDMGTKWTADQEAVISAMMCRKDGTNYDEESITISDTAPKEPDDQALWLDTSGENDVLKQYSDMHKEWVQVATTFIKIQADGIGKGLKESDVVHLSGVRAQAAAAPVSEGEETLVFPANDVHMYSSFHTTHQGGTNWVSTEASFASESRTIKVEGIPEGAAIKKAVARCKIGHSAYGAKLLTINREVHREGTEPEIPLELNGNGEVNLKFDFRSKNNATVSGYHGGTLSITEIRVEVTYGASSGGETSEADKKQLEALNNTNTVYGCGDNYIIVAGLLHRAVTLDNTLMVELRIPDLDYVCEANNRLWGCSYAAANGVLTNEIRCCALGDFRNWYKFEGTSMDSYVMSVGSDGPFTGAYSLQGTPLMFKEDALHKISGTKPSNFTLNTIKCRGVQDGSWRSLAVVNETLFYKARNDVMAYDGAPPYSVSEKLGTGRFFDAVGGAYRDKYYICMRDENIRCHLYVLDTAKGLWHKEDENKASFMASADGELIMAVESGEGTDLVAVGNQTGDKERFPWSATFGVYGYNSERAKYLSRFNIRAQMEAGSVMMMEIQYDSSGKWEKMGEMRSKKLQTFMLPVIPRRCDHCQVRISGTGDVRVYSIARVYEEGGN